MEFYKLIPGKKIYPDVHYVILESGKMSTYDKNMTRVRSHDNHYNKSRFLENFTLVTDENELAKLLLVYN